MNYVGQCVKVTQEVCIEGDWTPIEYGGWVAQDEQGMLVLDNGDTYAIAGDEVRSTVISVVSTRSKPAWELHPTSWKKAEDGWEVDIQPKVVEAECFKCSLVNSRIANDPERAFKADILHIAEAPGYNEVERQSFMVGKSGTLYRSLVEQILLGYTSTINNACMCYGETPDARAIEACGKRLRSDIDKVDAKVIVAVGAVALKALTGLDGITEHQGRIIKGYGPTPIIPCFHPAAVSRRPELFPDLAHALSLVKMYLDGEGLIDIQPDAFDKRIATHETCVSLLSLLSSYPRIYCDLETTGLSPYVDTILCATVAGGDDTGVKLGVIFPWDVVRSWWENFKEFIEGRKIGYYNGQFDCQFLRSTGILAWIGDDVMLKHYTLDERAGAQGLKYVARRFCNAPDWEEPLRQYLPTRASSYADIPKDVLYLYATLDVCYTGTVDPLLDKLMSKDNKHVYENILLPAANMLLDVSRVGLMVDTGRLEELRPELIAQIEELRLELCALAGEEFNPGSVPQTRAVMVKLFGYDGPTGRPVLEERFSGEPFIEKLLVFRTTRKMLGTYVEGLLDDIVDGRVHPNLRLNGTTTGRLSSSG